MIHRINLPVTDYQEVELPGRVISVAPCRSGKSDVFDLWYETGGTAERKKAVYVFGTGHPTPWTPWTRHAYHFIGTVVTPSGLVWHVYVSPYLHGDPIPA